MINARTWRKRTEYSSDKYLPLYIVGSALVLACTSDHARPALAIIPGPAEDGTTAIHVASSFALH